jgi:hypothetical protein
MFFGDFRHSAQMLHQIQLTTPCSGEIRDSWEQSAAKVNKMKFLWGTQLQVLKICPISAT